MVRSDDRGAVRTVMMETEPVRAQRWTGIDEETR